MEKMLRNQMIIIDHISCVEEYVPYIKLKTSKLFDDTIKKKVKFLQCITVSDFFYFLDKFKPLYYWKEQNK